MTYEDCLGLCDLSAEEIAAISEHEHIPEILAVELGQYLVHSEDGEQRISRMILDDIDEHEKRGETECVERLKLVLRHFLLSHPKARQLQQP